MISGTYVLTDTIDKAFSSIFADSYAGTDVVVSGKEARLLRPTSRRRPPPPVEASLLDEIRGLDSVGLAMGGDLRRAQHEDHRRRRQGDEHERRSELRVRDRHRARVLASSTRSTCSRAAGPRATARSSSTPARPTARTSRSARRSRSRRCSRSRTSRSSGSRSTATSSRSAPRRSRSSTSRPRRSSSTARGSSTRSRSRRRRARRPTQLDRRHRAAPPGGRPGEDRRRGGAGVRGRDRRVHDVLPLLPARVRRDRALRRLVRHLQHALDHRRPADARVRDAADARRLAASGAPHRCCSRRS